MSVAEIVLQKVLALPVECQREVLAFVEQLERTKTAKTPRIDPEGLLADLGVDLSYEEFAQVRREMWGQSPREDI